MLKKPHIQKLPIEQKKQFLSSRLTEEEMSEVFKRLKEQSSSDAPESKVITSPKPGYMTNSPQTESRLAQTNSHFLMNALNIASLSIVTSVGVTYLLDTVKEKKDEVMRQEMKDRLYSTLQDST